MAFCSSLAFLLVRVFRLVSAVSISCDLYALRSTPSTASSSPSKPRLSLPFSRCMQLGQWNPGTLRRGCECRGTFRTPPTISRQTEVIKTVLSSSISF
ncbi:hypothetical protein ACFX12_012597 [Malus domestica]